MDICFLTCICLWQISQIQTFLFKVVGPGLVSTSSAFVSLSASHPAGPHGRHAPKNGKSGPHCWGRGGSIQFAQQLVSAVTAPPLVGCDVWSLLNTSAHPSQDTDLVNLIPCKVTSPSTKFPKANHYRNLQNFPNFETNHQHLLLKLILLFLSNIQQVITTNPPQKPLLLLN